MIDHYHYWKDLSLKLTLNPEFLEEVFYPGSPKQAFFSPNKITVRNPGAPY